MQHPDPYRQEPANLPSRLRRANDFRAQDRRPHSHPDWQTQTGPDPGADRRPACPAEQTACPDPARPARQRSSSGSICPTRCAPPRKAGHPDAQPSTRRQKAVGRRSQGSHRSTSISEGSPCAAFWTAPPPWSSGAGTRRASHSTARADRSSCATTPNPRGLIRHTEKRRWKRS